MKRPKEPLLRIVQEGTLNVCKCCGSSLVYKWYDFLNRNELGCLQPKCENYYLRDNK